MNHFPEITVVAHVTLKTPFLGGKGALLKPQWVIVSFQVNSENS